MHKVEYHIAKEKNEAKLHKILSVDLTNIMFNERSNTQMIYDSIYENFNNNTKLYCL